MLSNIVTKSHNESLLWASSNYRMNLNPHHVSINKLNDILEKGGLNPKQSNCIKTNTRSLIVFSDGFSPNYLVSAICRSGLIAPLKVISIFTFRRAGCSGPACLLCNLLVILHRLSESRRLSSKQFIGRYTDDTKVAVCLYSVHARPLFTLDKMLKKLWWVNWLPIKQIRRLCEIEIGRIKPSDTSYRASDRTSCSVKQHRCQAKFLKWFLLMFCRRWACPWCPGFKYMLPPS